MIRQAQLTDAPALLELGEKVRRTLPVHYPFPTIEPIENFIKFCLGNPDIGCLLVEGEPIRGFIVGGISVRSFSYEKEATCLDFCVDPDRRGIGPRLIRAYEDWAKTMGCIAVFLSTASGFETDRTCVLYERMGFEYVGKIYRKEING